MMMRKTGIALALALTSTTALAQSATLSAEKAEFRALFQELIETDTSVAAGRCALAADRVAARLKAAGFKYDQLSLVTDPARPQEGGLVALLPGSSDTLKAALVRAHLDVDAAKRA